MIVIFVILTLLHVCHYSYETRSGKKNDILIKKIKDEEDEEGKDGEPTFLGPDWTYTEQELWPERYPACGGVEQSPINIELDLVKKDQVTEIFLDPNYSKCCVELELENTGRSVEVTAKDPKNKGVFLSGPAVDYKLYYFYQLHFHWGENNDRGSEHAINGERFAMELHLVHFNARYGSLEEARNKSDGLLVLAILFRVSDYENSVLEDIVKKLKKVQCGGQSYELGSRLGILDLIPTDYNRFYQYQGSLTTPPCFETVNWIVFKNPREIGVTQIEKFRELYEDGRCETRYGDNIRDLQPLNERTVYKSTDHSRSLNLGKLGDFFLG